jgi:predicted esterase
VRRSLPSTALAVVAVAGAVTLASCTPTVRYTDEVFPNTTKATATYATADDLTTGDPVALKLDVFQPAGDTLTARPLIVWIHGGGFKAGSKEALGKVAAAYARRGYVTASIDYRLDPGLRCQELQDGKIRPGEVAAETARCRTAIEAAQADALSAIRWLRSKASTYRIDTTRVAVGGGSAGAVTAINVGQRANPDHGPVPAADHVDAVLAMSGCQYDPPSIDANDAPLSLLASGGDQAVPYACTVATADQAASFGTGVQRIFYPSESGHAQGLYLTHQATVDAGWARFLKKHLRL